MNAVPGYILNFCQPAVPPLGPFGSEAVNLRGFGLAPLPVSTNKKPRILFKHLKRKHSIPYVERLAVRHADANVAIILDLCNPPLTVVDVDDPALINAMLDRFGPTPLQVNTPSGGRHLYYKHDNEKQNNRLEDMKVDIKAGRGYVIVPPSFTRIGAYDFESGSWSDVKTLPCIKAGALP